MVFVVRRSLYGLLSKTCSCFPHFINTFIQFMHYQLAFTFQAIKIYSMNNKPKSIHSTKNFFMTCLFTYKKTKKPNQKTSVLSFVLLATMIISSFNSHAQNILVGLTSNGGIDGKGTAFSINTNGNNFSIIKGFADWGIYPNGSLFKNDDGNFYGMTSSGGTNDDGTIFKMAPTGEMTMLKQ